MLSEISFEDFDRLDTYERTIVQPGLSLATFHQAICTSTCGIRSVERMIISDGAPTEIEQRTQRLARSHRIEKVPMGNVSGEAGITISWGGDNGPSVGGYVSGGASDDKGNSVEVNVQVNGDGTGSATASASHDEDTGS